MYETRQTTIPFPSRLNDCHCEDKNGSYGPPFSEAHSCGASHINKSIPRKEKSLGSFTLPCYINNVCFDNSLADLGASVNRTVKYPKGIAENVLVGIGKFVFLVDFSILTDFAVLEDMDAYRDEGMGDVIFGESFLREDGINAKRFEGMITIYNGNEEVTY
ncbi:hypothetical protein Tco_0281111 [Tanacetum coccineum]